MTQLSPAIVIEDNLELLSLPDIVIQLNEMLDDPACNAADISQLISRDDTLSNRLLKIVNSPLYGIPSRIDSVSMALTATGAVQLRDMVMALSLINHFNHLPEGLISAAHFWRHGIAVATAARVLAARLQIPNSEQFFIAGLLHDIGKLAMYLLQPDISREVLVMASRGNHDVHTLEQTAFGFDHAELGAELLRQWHLPGLVIKSVANHHHPTGAGKFVKEAAIVHLANTIGNTIDAIISIDDDFPVDSRVWEILQLDPNEQADLTMEAHVMQHSLQNIFLELYNERDTTTTELGG